MRWIPAHFAVMLFASGIFASSAAHAERASYRSSHPIPAELPGSFCHIEASHTHTYTPGDETIADYVHHDAEGTSQLEFVGDPISMGFEGPVTTYGEAHPMQFLGGSSETKEICQTEGTHYHLREPLDLSQYEDRKGTYYFESYKAAMAARRILVKLRKAEAREWGKAERQRERERRLEERATRKENSKERARKSVTGASTSRTKTKGTSTKLKSKPKPPKKGYRSWMDRRRGK